MQVILTEKVRHLGALGDQVNVKNGFARNFLIPQKKAVIANAENLRQFETKRAELEKKEKTLLSQAEQRAAKINDVVLTITALASEEGKLYGSIGNHEIREALKAKSIDVEKREIMMPQGPFHETGEFKIEIMLHSDVIATLQLQIVAEKAQ